MTDEELSKCLEIEAERDIAQDEIERLRAALKGVVSDVLEYERINNLAPNPGRKFCWDSVAHAHEIIND